MHIAIGFALGVVLAWPRVTPEVVYYADPQRGLFHGDKDCAYSSSPTFAARADAGTLHPCRKCLPHASDKVADRDSHKGQDDTD